MNLRTRIGPRLNEGDLNGGLIFENINNIY